MVLSVKVGNPAQRLFVGVSFNRRDTWLYAKGECPPFVDCYQASDSHSFGFNYQERSIYSNGASAGGFSCADDFSLSESVGFYSDFVHITYSQDYSVIGRDTAGQLALGPTSEIGANHVIELKADLDVVGRNTRALPRWNVVLNPDIPPLSAGQVEINFHIDTRRNAWQFPLNLYVSGVKLFVGKSVTFIPNQDDVIIPEADGPLLLSHLIPKEVKYMIGASGRLFMECSSGHGPAKTNLLKQMSLRKPDGKRFINILASSLAYSGIVNSESIILDNGRFCPTRIVFAAGEMSWTFGLPLLASVQAVYLDGASSRISFRMLGGNRQRGENVVDRRPASPESLGFKVLPRFSGPELVIEGRGVRSHTSIRFSTSWSREKMENGLVFHSTNSEGNEDSSEFRFIFNREHNSLLHHAIVPPTVRELEGLYQVTRIGANLFESRLEGSVVAFDFKAATDPDESSYTVSIIEDNRRVEVVIRKTEVLIDLEHFDMSSTLRVTEEFVADRCGICRDQIQKESEQQVLPCGDKFHPGCIQRWLGRNRSCPLCRKDVPLKNTGKPILLKRFPDEEEGDDSSGSL